MKNVFIFICNHLAIKYEENKKIFKNNLLYATHVLKKLFDSVTQKTFRNISKTLYCNHLKKQLSAMETKIFIAVVVA